MIHVVHNAVDQMLEHADIENLEDVLKHCGPSQADVPHLFTHIRLDGLDLPEDSFERFDEISVADVSRIEVESRPTLEIALSSLNHSSEYTTAIRRAIDRSVELFRIGRSDDANDLLAEISDSLGVLLAAVSGAAAVLTEASDRLLTPLNDLAPWLDQVLEGQSSGDWVYVADILEYEVDLRLEGWARVMSAVHSESA